MTTNNPTPAAPTPPPPPPHPPRRRRTGLLVLILILAAVATAAVTALLVNIFQRKQEAKQLWVRKVEVTEDTTDPAPWGLNWPSEYDGYKKTQLPSHTNFGGGDAQPPAEKAQRYPWLTRIFAGYAFSLDYRD